MSEQISYVNVYKSQEGNVEFGIVTDTPEKAASYVYICDGVPISLLKLIFDLSKPFGQRVKAEEIRQ